MARIGLWVAVLGLCCLAAWVDAQGVPVVPVPDNSQVCKRFSRDGVSMGMAEVFDMIMIQFRDKVNNMNTEVVKKYMVYDADHDNRLTMSECEKLVQDLRLNKI